MKVGVRFVILALKYFNLKKHPWQNVGVNTIMIGLGVPPLNR
jgi:hypothetical protein